MQSYAIEKERNTKRNGESFKGLNNLYETTMTR